MYNPDHFLRDVLAVFDSQSGEDFRGFLARHSGSNEWILSSDYNLGQYGRPQDVIAFTLYPMSFASDTNAKLGQLFPDDFKKVKDVSDKAKAWYRSGSAFHICFIMEKQTSFFHSAGADRLEVVRDSLEKTVAYLVDKKAPDHIIKRHRDLVRQSKSRSFNVRLWSDVLLLSICYSFIIGLLTRENRLDFCLWCSDRDAMTTWNDGILYDIALVQAVRYAQKFHRRYDAEHLPVLVLTQDKSAKLYDHVIRPADYLAAAISAWSLRANSTHEGAKKYEDMLSGVIAENRYVSSINVEMGRALMHIRGLKAQRIVLEDKSSGE